MNTMLDAIKLFAEGKNVDVFADQRLICKLQAIVTIADTYISNYTGPGGDDIAPMETVRMLAMKCLTEEVVVKAEN